MTRLLSPSARVLGGTLLAFSMAGCMATAPRVEVMEPTQARPIAIAPPSTNSGSLFQNVGYRPLYETPRARQVGDIVTINIVERITAKQESTSSIDKTGTISGSVSAFPFLQAGTLAKLNAGGTSNNSFDGKGSTESNNTFTGNITASVIEVLPNGHLVVAGEKQIGVNHNVEVLRFSGQIDPLKIQPGNVVSSATVANVRVEQRGRGAQGESQGIGWLARFFLSLSPI
ncbi:MAG: flagellar basal body L-ring protein FlgH [Aquabacterium sp.]|jgi:flagellar L-ring protein FlgH|uniref:flagellar basal body L-ring protein FlgH n=1 Tax=Aquabacterium sp. TaxID=1872578 RepID=UPI003BB00724